MTEQPRYIVSKEARGVYGVWDTSARRWAVGTPYSGKADAQALAGKLNARHDEITAAPEPTEQPNDSALLAFACPTCGQPVTYGTAACHAGERCATNPEPEPETDICMCGNTAPCDDPDCHWYAPARYFVEPAPDIQGYDIRDNATGQRDGWYEHEDTARKVCVLKNIHASTRVWPSELQAQYEAEDAATRPE